MTAIQIAAVLISLAAAFGYVNHRVLRMPMSVGLMLQALVLAVVLILLGRAGLPVNAWADRIVTGIDFHHLLMDGMLGLLLFAGALHVNLDDLAEEKLPITVYSTVGVLTSTVLVGSAVHALSQWAGWSLRPVDCFLFGALISPTDPIAVLGILKRAGAPRVLETRIAGESLFNDGIGVVVFLAILEIATLGTGIDAGAIGMLLLKEAGGGLAFGLTAGYAAYRLLKSVNHYQVEILITLALVLGGYALAAALHLSAPLAMVAAGLLVGNRGRRLAMSDETRENLDTFWELIDEILNAVLFVLVGLEVLVLTFNGAYLAAGLAAIPVALLARLISVGGPSLLMARRRPLPPRGILVMTWGGLRGGISVALALSLPEEAHRDLVLAMTYAVVVFSVLVQGLTVGRLAAGARAVDAGD